MPPTQPLPDTPAPSHLFETHNMVSDTQPTAPQMPSCENCGVPAQLQCGMCKELFFCDTPACYDACHPRPRDREAHRASVTSFGASSKCAHHPGQELSLVCEDPACGDVLICMCCAKCDTHAGHKTVVITDYMKRQRNILHSHVADLTTQQTAAEEQMCGLKTFVAKAGHMIAECKAVCQLGDDQVLRAVTESQAIVRSINSMAASGDRHRLVGAADPHATFSQKLPVSSVHDALAQMSALVVPVLVQGLDGVEHEIEVSVDDTGRDLLRKVASAMGLREGCFDMRFRGEVIAEGETVVQLRGHRVVVTHSQIERRKRDAIAALRALGETKITTKRFYRVTDPEVACLLLQAGVATAIPDDFFSRTDVECIDLSHASAVTEIGKDFLCGCMYLSEVDLSGLQYVTTLGDYFLSRCESLYTVDLSGLQGVTSIGNNFLMECTSLSTVSLSGLQAVTSLGDGFLWGCTSLSTVDLSGLQAVTSIGDGFLSRCESLSTLDLSGLQAVTSVGSHSLSLCTSLLTVDLSGLHSVTTIRECFLHQCTSLSAIDFSGLKRVTSIGHSCLWGCTSLSTVDLSGLQGVTSMGPAFLRGCHRLTLHGEDKCSSDVLNKLPY